VRRHGLLPSCLLAAAAAMYAVPLCAQTPPPASQAGANGQISAEQRIEQISDKTIARQNQTAGQIASAPSQPPSAQQIESTMPASGASAAPPTSKPRSMVSQRKLNESLQNAAGSRGEGNSAWVFHTLTSLGVVIALILLMRWGWAKLGGHVTASGGIGASAAVEVLSRTTIAPRNHILLVRVANRILVLGDSVQGLSQLSQIEDPQQVAEILAAISASQNNSMTNRFNQMLGRFNSDYDAHAHKEEGTDDQEHYVDRARDSLSSLLSRVRLLSRRGGAA
jgi:flagellar biogenesis protein FliO